MEVKTAKAYLAAGEDPKVEKAAKDLARPLQEMSRIIKVLDKVGIRLRNSVNGFDMDVQAAYDIVAEIVAWTNDLQNFAGTSLDLLDILAQNVDANGGEQKYPMPKIK